MKTETTRRLIGSKDELIEHLVDYRHEKADAGDDPNALVRDRQHLGGVVEGLDYAIQALRDWEEPHDAPSTT